MAPRNNNITQLELELLFSKTKKSDLSKILNGFGYEELEVITEDLSQLKDQNYRNGDDEVAESLGSAISILNNILDYLE